MGESARGRNRPVPFLRRVSPFRITAAPLLLGFVLGPLLEENLRRAMILGRGDPTVFLARPISGGLLLLTALVVVVMLLPRVRRKRQEVFVEGD